MSASATALKHILQAEDPRPLELIETPLSIVLLSPEKAFKIRKPVANGFVDYSAPQDRYAAQKAEWDRGSRHAGQIYQAFLALRPDLTLAPSEGVKDNLDWIIVTRRLATTDLVSHQLCHHPRPEDLVNQLAGCIAMFHRQAEPAPDGPWASLPVVSDVFDTNIARLLALLKTGSGPYDEVIALAKNGRQMLDQIGSLIEARSAAAIARTCHGDLHLSNLVWQGDHVAMFDFLDGPERLLYIDPIMDFAMAYMDVLRLRAPLADLLKDRYFDQFDDPDGLALLPFCTLHRTLVRARVAASQHRDNPTPHIQPYLTLARALSVHAGSAPGVRQK